MLYKLPQLLKVVVVYGLLFLTFGSLLEAFHPPAQNIMPASSSVVAAASPEAAASAPEKLVIPRLHMNLSVIPGVYDPTAKAWTLTDANAQYATVTSLPNDHAGDTLIYGHNTSKVLAPTSGLKQGDTAQVTTKDGRVFTYAYTGDRFVVPSDISVLNEANTPPRLTLLTCNGLWDSKRRLMIFDFVSVQ